MLKVESEIQIQTLVFFALYCTADVQTRACTHMIKRRLHLTHAQTISDSSHTTAWLYAFCHIARVALEKKSPQYCATDISFLLPAILWIRMAEARYQDGDEDCPNVSTTGRRDSTGKTILIAKFKLYSGDLKHVSDRFQDLLCVLYSITHEYAFGDFLMWRCFKKLSIVEL